jgi:DNA-binding MarR family transcriptional regulator
MTDPATDKDVYLQSLLLIERLHRRLLDVLKAELDRIGRADINNVQALILYNIGDDELTVGELTYRGYYLGSNVSYNVKKLVENDYLQQERSRHDRRSVRIRLSDKGKALRDEVNELFEGQIGRLFGPGALPREQVAAMNDTLRKLERFWSAEVQFGG